MERSIKKLLMFFFSVLIAFQPTANLNAQNIKEPSFQEENNIQEPREDLFADMEFDESSVEEQSFLPESFKPIWYFGKIFNNVRHWHPLNPEDSLFEITKQKSFTIFDFDWTPRLSDSIEFRSRAALSYLVEDGDASNRNYFLEGYLQWQNESKTVVLDVGKVKTEWGSGYAWNPSQVLVPLNEDVSDDIEKDEGIEMIKIEVVGNTATSTAIIASLKREDVTADSPFQAVFKTSLEFESWEISFVHHQATQSGWTNALSFTGLLTDTLEFHGEASRSELRDRLTVRKEAEGIQMGPDYLPARYDYVDIDHDREFDKYLLGGQYTFAGGKNLILELYKTAHGYSDQEWEAVKNGVQEALTDDAWKNPNFPYTTSAGNPYSGYLKNTMNAVRNEELRQNYLFLRFTSGESDNHWEWEQVVLLNLDDNSQIHQGSLHKTWFDLIKSSLQVTLFRGDTFSEFGLNPYREIASLEIEIRF